MHPAGRSGNINTDNNDAKWGHFTRPRWGQCKRPQREAEPPSAERVQLLWREAT